MNQLISDIRSCKVCESHLILGCRPIVTLGVKSKILIIGQALGMKVHQFGIPWNDASGNNLRNWLGIDKDLFYNTDYISIMPMGFCYPGIGKSGDLPPRPECAPLWHEKILHFLPNIELILLIGQYSQNYYLKEKSKKTLKDKVKKNQDYLPTYFTLPHPSPRNNLWMKKTNGLKLTFYQN